MHRAGSVHWPTPWGRMQGTGDGAASSACFPCLGPTLPKPAQSSTFGKVSSEELLYLWSGDGGLLWAQQPRG